MVGLKRRRKIEGWALDVSDADINSVDMTLRQRLADNNKLWLVCAVAVVLITGLLIWNANRAGAIDEKAVVQPKAVSDNTPVDDAHVQFAREFAADKTYGPMIISARFAEPGSFRLVVPGDVSADEIDYMSKMAAEKISHQFNHRVVVEVYAKSVADGRENLVATTKWTSKKFGGYVVDLKDPGKNLN